MAILYNILRGQLKGRLGNNYFQTAKSKTGRPVSVLNTINSNPENPRTDSQMLQRAKFANAVKFYRHATSNFFKFAFEDKKANESDYNAFMRNNIDKSLFLPKDYVNSPIFPALGNKWMLSKGSLAFGLPWTVPEGIDNQAFTLGWVGGTSVQTLSSILIRNYNMKIGDIVTFVFVQSDVTELSLANINELSAPLWEIFQFKVSLSNSTRFDKIEHVGSEFMVVSSTESGIYFTPEADEQAIWGALVVTRKSSKLLAQTSYLEPNYYAKQLIAAATTSNINTEALESWQAQDAAILQGGVADNAGTVASDTDYSDVVVTKIECTTTGTSADGNNFNIGTMSRTSYVFKITGTNLPDATPTSSNTLRATISDFTHTSDTEVSFTVTRGSSAGSVSIDLWGKALIVGTVPSASSDEGTLQTGDNTND